MSTLPFSLASPTHTKQIRTSSLTAQAAPAFKIYANHEQKFNKKSNSQQLEVNVGITTNSLLRRREAIGLGLSFTTLLDFLSQNVAIAAEATASCEFTTTPSGLAFCDKVVGFGPEASKGQLIKVTTYSLINLCFLFLNWLYKDGMHSLIKNRNGTHFYVCDRHIIQENWRMGRCLTAAITVESLLHFGLVLARYTVFPLSILFITI